MPLGPFQRFTYGITRPSARMMAQMVRKEDIVIKGDLRRFVNNLEMEESELHIF